MDIGSRPSDRGSAASTRTVDQELYRLLVEGVRDYAIVFLDPQGRIRSWNTGAERLHGHRAQEILGQPLATLYVEDPVPAGPLPRVLDLALAEGRAVHEGWLRRKDDSRFWGEQTLTPLLDDRGHLRGFASVTRDLTERRRLEDAARMSEERYRLMVDSVRDYAIFMLDPTGHIQSWNLGAQMLKGYRAEEIIGRHFRTFYPPEDVAAKKPERELEIALAVGRVEDEGWRVRKDGTRFWANVIITALRDEHGVLRGFGKVTRDLTERRGIEDALRASEERYRLMVESVQDYAIFMLDPTGHVQSWNLGAEMLKGYRAEEVLGRHFRTFYLPEDVAAKKPERELEIALAQGRVEDEGWRVRKDGSQFWANVIITPLWDEHGVLRGFGKVTRDLTLRRRLEEERLANLAHAAEVQRLSSMNAFKTQFINIAAHELNTPLTPILLQLDLLRARGSIGPQDARSLTILHRNIGRLQDLVAELLDVTRLEAGRLSLDLKPMDLIPVLDDLVESFLAPAKQAGVALSLDALPLPLVRADERRVVQALSNLLGNALKFTPPGGHINVRAEDQGESVLVRIEDSGVGIDPSDLGRLFTPFTQLHTSQGPPREGTGLGLFIVKGIVEAQGGKVGVSSPGLGKGATFWFTLPVDKGTPPPAGSTD